MMKIMIGLLTLVLCSQAFADNCARPRNTFDSLYCARKIFFELDDSLNITYKKLRKKLNKQQKRTLKKSQLAWIKSRDNTCTTGNAVIVSCAVKKTRERLTFLQNRVFECNSVGCINKNLAKVKD